MKRGDIAGGWITLCGFTIYTTIIMIKGKADKVVRYVARMKTMEQMHRVFLSTSVKTRNGLVDLV
jgi:hypothetical protein